MFRWRPRFWSWATVSVESRGSSSVEEEALPLPPGRPEPTEWSPGHGAGSLAVATAGMAVEMAGWWIGLAPVWRIG